MTFLTITALGIWVTENMYRFSTNPAPSISIFRNCFPRRFAFCLSWDARQPGYWTIHFLWRKMVFLPPLFVDFMVNGLVLWEHLRFFEFGNWYSWFLGVNIVRPDMSQSGDLKRLFEVFAKQHLYFLSKYWKTIIHSAWWSSPDGPSMKRMPSITKSMPGRNFSVPVTLGQMKCPK